MRQFFKKALAVVLTGVLLAGAALVRPLLLRSSA